MKVSKVSNLVGLDPLSGKVSNSEQIWGYITDLDSDIKNLVVLSQGRVRFGTGVTAARGENISGEFRVFASAAIGSTAQVLHTLGATPIGFLTIAKTGFGDIYMSSATTSNAYFASTSTAGTSYTVFLLK